MGSDKNNKLYTWCTVRRKTSAGISKDGDFFNVTRNSSVGVELNQLDLDKFFSLGYQLHQENLNSGLSRAAKPGLGIFNILFQSLSDRFGYKALQTVLNDKYTQKLYQPVEILAEEDTNGENDDIERELKQKVSLNIKPGKDLRKDNKTEKQYETMNRSDPKEISLPQRDNLDVAEIKTFADDSTHIDTDNSRLEQQNREREGRRKNKDRSDVTEQTNSKGKKLYFRKFKSADFVPAFKFKGWPRPAEEWIYRKRMWPPKRIMKEVLDVGCQVVAKRSRVLLAEDNSCCNGAKEEKDNYFRLSFALCEVVIAREMSEQQLLCWRVLKAYQKCFLKTKPQAITSYHWKNVIFWVFEEFDKSFWDDSHVLHGVQRSLDFMISCLEQRFLPFYFVRRMNLLHGYNETMITDVCARVRMIRSSPILYLKRFLKFQGMSNVEFISIDHEKVEEIITEKHETDEINEENECFLDVIAMFCKDRLEKNESEQLKNDFFKLNKCTRAVRRSLNTGDDIDKELKYHALTFMDAFEKCTGDKMYNTEAYTASIKAFENLLKTKLKNEEIQNEIHDNNATMAVESFMALMSECPRFLTGEQTHANSFIEKFCDTSETMRKMTTDVWTRGAASEDEKTKGKVNAVISLMETFSTLLPHIKNVFVRNTTDNKKQMNIELD